MSAAQEVRRTTELPSGHVLSLCKGDITDEAVDAIVNAANTGLAHGGGVAGAIVRRGGQTIQNESDRIGRVATGGAAITGAGRLAARFVIHAVGPVWREHTPGQADHLLAAAVTAALEIAHEKGLGSIPFPAISSGIFGFPKERCAWVMTEALVRWAAEHPDGGPRDLRFTLIDDTTLDIFAAEWGRRFDGG